MTEVVACNDEVGVVLMVPLPPAWAGATAGEALGVTVVVGVVAVDARAVSVGCWRGITTGRVVDI